MNNEQPMLFDNLDDFDIIKREWNGMPEFIQEDKEPVQKIIVSFASDGDVKQFGELIGQSLTPQTKSVWYPKEDYVAPSNFIYTDEE